MKKAMLYVIMMLAVALSAFAAQTVTLTGPSNGGTVMPNPIMFTYTVQDDTANSTTCSFLSNSTTVSGTTVQSLNTAGNIVASGNFNLTLLQGQYVSWSVNCTDANSNVTGSSINTLTIRAAPVITTTPATTAVRNTQYAYTMNANVFPAGTVTYSLVSAPAWLTQTGTNTFSGMPTSIAQESVTVKATDSAGLTANQTFTISTRTDSKLRISNVNIKISGDDNNVGNFGTIENSDALMGESLAMYVEICNDQPFDDAIKNVEATDITIKDIDGGNDIEGKISRFTLDGASCEEKKVSLDMDKIPLTAEFKTYRVTVKVTGKNDTNGVSMSDMWNVNFRVYKDSDPNIKISESTLFPTEVSCDRSFSLDVQGVNIGDNDDSAVLKIEAPALKIYDLKEFEIGDDPSETVDDCNAIDEPDQACTRFEHSFSYKAADTLAAGSYPITLTTYYETSRQSDKRIINLLVSKCAVETTPVVTPPVTTPVVTTPVVTVPKEPVVVVQELQKPALAPSSTPIKIVERKSFADSQTYTLLLVLANIGLFAIIIAVLKQAFTKKQ